MINEMREEKMRMMEDNMAKLNELTEARMNAANQMMQVRKTHSFNIQYCMVWS